MTFDEWNRAETARLCVMVDWDNAKHIRRARSGGMARFIFFDDYEKWCRDNGVVPEKI